MAWTGSPQPAGKLGGGVEEFPHGEAPSAPVARRFASPSLSVRRPLAAAEGGGLIARRRMVLDVCCVVGAAVLYICVTN